MQFGIGVIFNLMQNVRLIGRLDIKGKNLIKGVQLEGLRVMGSPSDFGLSYYQQGIDELIYMDCVASLYGRNQLSEIISNAAKDIFVPITVGGGIRSCEDVTSIMRAGADKVAINTAAIKDNGLISEIAEMFGSQCMVLSIEAKRIGNDAWEVYTDNGRERTGINVIDWAKKGERLGAGELLVTSVDNEGTRKGFDVELIHAVTKAVSIPVIASGGMGKPSDIIPLYANAKPDAFAVADILHYKRASVQELRLVAISENLGVRHFESG